MAETQKKNSFLKNLVIRVISALILIPVVLYPVLEGGYYLKALLIVVTFLLGYEYVKLANLNDKTRAVITAGLFATIWWLFAMDLPEGFVDGIKVMAITAVTIIGVGYILKKTRMCWAGLGVGYISIPMFSIALIGLHPEASNWLLWMLGVVWANDVGAYFAGKSIGGPKLVPTISPNKTWAGLFGGVLAAAGAGAFVADYLGMDDVRFLAMAAAFFAIVAGLGDLAESAVKRKFKAKDSGFLIPGHGGILDRLDGILFVAPVLALALELQLL